MRLQFCTLFNSNYLSKGLTLYRSLENSCPDFHLYVFAFDKACEEYLRAQHFPKLTVIGLSEFEDPELLQVKSSRSAAEYCWTCTSSTILYCIEKYKLDHCTYLDADMFFYADPALLLAEMGDKDVMLTEHRYSPAYDQSLESGRFCVQFVFFRNTTNGMKALRWWRAACIEWCYARAEDGKFGDQKYLDDWETRFEGVHVLQHTGGGIAPWNIQQYEFFHKAGKPFIREKKNGNEWLAVFFHFHGLKFFADKTLQLSGPAYEITEDAKHVFFFPYIRNLLLSAREIKKSGIAFDPNGASGKAPRAPWGIRILLFYYLADLKADFFRINGKNLSLRRRHHHYYFQSSFAG